MLEAERIAALIRKKGLDTRAEGECMSACTSVLLAGKTRTAPETARIGFHQPSFPGVSGYALRGAIDKTGRDYVAAGVHPQFVSRALATPAQGMWIPTPEQLVEGGVLTGSDIFVTDSDGSKRRETPAEMRLRRGLSEAAARMNSGMPVRIDDLTTLERVSASGTTLIQHYRVRTEGADVAGSRAALTRSFRQEICSDVRSALAVSQGGRFVLSYRDLKGRLLFEIAVSRCFD
jgi:hypothetical protein